MDHICPPQVLPGASNWLPRRMLSVAFVIASGVGLPPASASAPVVHFDLAPATACRDVTTPEFAAAHPGDRLLEVTLEISTMLTAGESNDFEYFIQVLSPGRHLSVVDYAPKTTLASDYAGNISVEKRNESSKSAGVTVSGVWNQLVNIAGSGDIGSKDNLAVRYELHAPQSPVTSSGTILRGAGAYFKLRPSRQTSLEGARPFTIVFRAPDSWRGDYLQVHCECSGTRHGVVRSLDERFRCGVRDFFVGLYLAGDNEAKQSAERMVQAEHTLRVQLQRHRAALRKEAPASLADQVISLWKPATSTESSTERVERLLFSTPHPSAAQKIPAELPEGLTVALERYLAARLQLRTLAGPHRGA